MDLKVNPVADMGRDVGKAPMLMNSAEEVWWLAQIEARENVALPLKPQKGSVLPKKRRSVKRMMLDEFLKWVASIGNRIFTKKDA